MSNAGTIRNTMPIAKGQIPKRRAGTGKIPSPLFQNHCRPLTISEKVEQKPSDRIRSVFQCFS